MWCARLQEDSGWKLDIEYCTESLKELQKEHEEKVSVLTSLMPKVPVYVTKTKPKKMYKKDGSLSSLGKQWVDLLIQEDLPDDTEEVTLIKEYNEPNPNSTPQVKDWLFSLGWKPQTFKYEKDNEGKQRSIPQINKEAQKGGGICDSIKRLYEKEPNLEVLDGLSILSHRIGILSGFLRDQRDGYLKARISGLTNTLRVQHTEIVNLPRTDRPYALPVRGSLICEKDQEQLGADLSSLENYLKQHYIFPYDPKYVEEMNKEDFDPHLSLALEASAVNEDQVLAYKAGTDKSIKPTRDIFKNAGYSLQYGAFPPKVALTAGISKELAQEIFDAYWKKNWAIKAVVKDLTTKVIDGQMWQLNPVNKFWYSLRSEKDQFSTLVQGTASYVFDTWLKYILQERPQLTATFHDELVIVIRKGFRQEATNLVNKAIRKLNEELNLNIILSCGIQFGERYSDIH